jgi:hypothetical protein
LQAQQLLRVAFFRRMRDHASSFVPIPMSCRAFSAGRSFHAGSLEDCVCRIARRGVSASAVEIVLRNVELSGRRVSPGTSGAAHLSGINSSLSFGTSSLFSGNRSRTHTGHRASNHVVRHRCQTADKDLS